MCVFLCGYVQCLRWPKEGAGSSAVVVAGAEPLVWVLGTELGFSVKGANAHNKAYFAKTR